MSLTGKDIEEAKKMVTKYLNNITDSRDKDFILYTLAVMYVESAFNKYAVSHANAIGLMQMTQVALNDVSTSCNLPLIPLRDLHDPELNVKYGSCFLKSMLEKAEGNWTKALILYNGGFRQLTSYEKGESIASETANYVLKVNRAVNICRQH